MWVPGVYRMQTKQPGVTTVLEIDEDAVPDRVYGTHSIRGPRALERLSYVDGLNETSKHSHLLPVTGRKRVVAEPDALPIGCPGRERLPSASLFRGSQSAPGATPGGTSYDDA